MSSLDIIKPTNAQRIQGTDNQIGTNTLLFQGDSQLKTMPQTPLDSDALNFWSSPLQAQPSCRKSGGQDF